MQRRILLSMEIRVHSRLFLDRYKGCTNVSFILSRNYGLEEFNYQYPFSVQKAHIAVRAGKYLRPMQRRIVPSMEIRVYSRLFLDRYKGCTNARCILSRSYGLEEFKYQYLSRCKMRTKTVQVDKYLRPIQRRIVPSMESRVHSRLIPARHKGCTNAWWILSRRYGLEEFKYQYPFSV